MNIADFIRTVKAKITDSTGDIYLMDFYYGADEWKTLDLNNQKKDFIYLDPVEGDVPEKMTGFIREDYNLIMLVGRCMPLDLSKEQEEDVLWEMRPFAKQLIRRMFEETNTNDAKLLMPSKGAKIIESRKQLAANVYGVIVQMRAEERFPDETC